MVPSFSSDTSVFDPLKSYRWLISFTAWLTALSTSCMSTTETMSNDGMCPPSLCVLSGFAFPVRPVFPFLPAKLLREGGHLPEERLDPPPRGGHGRGQGADGRPVVPHGRLDDRRVVPRNLLLEPDDLRLHRRDRPPKAPELPRPPRHRLRPRPPPVAATRPALPIRPGGLLR